MTRPLIWRFILLAVAAHALTVVAHSAPVRNEPITPIPAVTVSPEDRGKVELGKMLFFEPRLSRSGAISCASCHNLNTGGVDNLPGSIGHGWQVGTTNSPTVLNSKLNIAQFWDGRAKDLEEQAGGPIANPKEMGSTHEAAVQTLRSIPGYMQPFKTAFGDSKITIRRVQVAIAAFEKTLLTPDAPFDRWLKGDDDALTVEEKEGYALFKNSGCVACHQGVGVGGGMYQKFGIVKPWRQSKSKGRYEVTGKKEDMFVFKVPMLRNVALTAPYFHDGSVWTLEEAVEIMGEYQLGLKIPRKNVTKIVAFLKTLTGEQPKVVPPTLPPRGKDTPAPSLAI